MDEENSKTLQLLADDLHQQGQAMERIERRLDRIEAERNSASARIWDIATKLALPLGLVVGGWLASVNGRVVELETRQREIDATRFTAQDGLRLEARIIERESPQIALLVQEMRAMSLQFTERLTRLETQVSALAKQPR